MDLEAAVRDVAPRLLGYCIARTGDVSVAEDVAQESLAALVQRWRRHGPPESADAFVFAIARRRAGRALVRRRLLAPLSALAGRAAASRTPEEQLLESAEHRAVRAAVATLSTRDREALLLVTVGGVRTPAAAQALGISQSALKMRTLRARRRLAALLERNDVPSR